MYIIIMQNTAGKISIESVTIFLSKYISKGAVDMKCSPDVSNNPSNPYIQRKQNKYSGAKKYLVSHQLCKFSHLKKMREACNLHHRYTSTMRDKIRKKNPENHIVGFLKNLFANYGGK